MTSLPPFRRTALAASVGLALFAGCGEQRRSGGTSAPRSERPPNLLLITVDTLRADHLSS
ncbi:MAG: hypothetical protein AB7G12_03020 [Thermoanaerobaculia bacterium]